MSKLKSAGAALNIAENAKISESALKMTEHLWKLNPGFFISDSFDVGVREEVLVFLKIVEGVLIR